MAQGKNVYILFRANKPKQNKIPNRNLQYLLIAQDSAHKLLAKAEQWTAEYCVEWRYTHDTKGEQCFVSWSCQTILVSPWQHTSDLSSYFSIDRNNFSTNVCLYNKQHSCNNEVSVVSAPVAAFYLLPPWSDCFILDSLVKSPRFTSSNATSYEAETEVSVQELFTGICSTFLCTLGLHNEENKQGSKEVGGESLHIFHWTRWRNRVLQFETLLWTVEFTIYYLNTKFQYKTRAEKFGP